MSFPALQPCEKKDPLKDPKANIPAWLKGKLKPYAGIIESISFSGKGSFKKDGAFDEVATIGNHMYRVVLCGYSGNIYISNYVLLYKKIKKKPKTQPSQRQPQPNKPL
jgi:hypothetical protein